MGRFAAISRFTAMGRFAAIARFTAIARSAAIARFTAIGPNARGGLPVPEPASPDVRRPIRVFDAPVVDTRQDPREDAGDAVEVL